MNLTQYPLMSLKKAIFVTFLVFSFQQMDAQRNFEEYNRLGLTGGFTFFDISTSNFETEQGQGFEGGFTTRGSFRGSFDLIYGISFYNNKIGIRGNDLLKTDPQSIKYQIQSAQIGLLGSLNIVKHHFSLEFGPILNVNGKMNLDNERYSDYILDGYTTLTANDIQDINRINFHVAGGITAGLKSFRLSALYQYGVTNIFDKFNDKNFENTDFEGHSSTITLAATIYF